MIIAQISDTHIALDTPDADQRIADLERTVDDLNSLDPLPDIVVHTGDVVQNGLAEEYAEAVRILAKARAPVYAMVGNKDDRANFAAAFVAGEYLAADSLFVDYAVEKFPVRVIAVDTLDTASNSGDFCAVRAERLGRLIEADRDRPIMVFAHHPPFEVRVGPDPCHFADKEAAARLRRIIRQSGRFLADACGHVHRSTSGMIGTTTATVAPCIATPLRKGEYPRWMTKRPVYHIHRFDPRGWFSAESRIV